MNRSLSTFAPALALTLSLLATQALLAEPAQARDRTATATGPNGKTATRQVSREEGQVSSSTTTSGGKTASREVERTATGTSATVTGPKGKTATRETTRTDTGSATTVTGPDGKQGSVTVQR